MEDSLLVDKEGLDKVSSFNATTTTKQMGKKVKAKEGFIQYY